MGPYLLPELKRLKTKCNELGLNFITVRERVGLGLAVKKVLKIPKNSRCFLDRKELKIREACKNHGLRYDVVQRRLRKGMSLKKAIEIKYEKGKYITVH